MIRVCGERGFPLGEDGLPCRAPAVHGKRYCQLHLPSGKRGPITGTTIKSPAGIIATGTTAWKFYHDARIEDLDEEVRVAYAALAWITEQWTQDPSGGVITQHGTGESGSDKIVPYVELLATHTERLERLKVSRMKLEAMRVNRDEVEALVKFAKEWKP